MRAAPSSRLLPQRRWAFSSGSLGVAAQRSKAFRAKGKRTDELRELLLKDKILIGPCCHDGLSARLIEKAGFPYAFMSGFCTSAARLGAPDTGLLSYYEMMDQGRSIHEATEVLPIIGDGDTGYGNAINVKRTVRGYAQAGFAGILIEDQVWPKSCGHVRGKRVTDRQEALTRIRAAVDARDEGADLLIVARTDARQAVSLEEALWRAQAFAEIGADIVFIDALESEEEMKQFCELSGAAQGVPKMANMLEGGGKTPLLPPAQLQALGFKLVAYPLSLLGVSIRAMETALEGLKAGQVPDVRSMGSFLDIQRAVGFPEYYEEEEKYARPWSRPTTEKVSTADSNKEEAPPGAPPPGSPSTSTTPEGAQGTTAGGDPNYVVADEVIPPGGTSALASSSTSSSGGGKEAGEEWNSTRDPRSQYLRVKISDQRTGLVKLETRIPAGFLGGLTALIPQVAGMNLEALVQQATGEKWDLSQPILNYNSGNDIIQVFLEGM